MQKTIMTCLACLAIMLVGATASFGSGTDILSVDDQGNLGNAWSYIPSISSDGRYATFESFASNLIPNDTNGYRDIFVRDIVAGTTGRVSVDSLGNEANGQSINARISSDGRYVVFQSQATNLVAGDTNPWNDIFIHDRQTGTTELINVDNSGNQGYGDCYSPSISEDGRYVAFWSSATNLVPNDTNGFGDIFLRDRQAGTTELVSVDSNGNQAAGSSLIGYVSADGRYVVFQSDASNLVPGDTNNTYDIFIRDRQNGTTELISVNDAGEIGNGYSDMYHTRAISDDGRYVAFDSSSDNLVQGDRNGARDSFVRDRLLGTTERVSISTDGDEANVLATMPSISGDGRFVAFYSDASTLVPDDTNGCSDVFVRDRLLGVTERVSVDSNGNQACNSILRVYMNGDGRFVVFDTTGNLVPGDGAVTWDSYVHDRIRDDDGDTYRNYIDGDCNDYDAGSYPGAPETVGDGIDQDCNGYDLSIRITKANYQANKTQLLVWATSDYGADAALVLEIDGFSPMPMTWTGNRWEITVDPMSADPGSVTVSGPEGSVSSPTN